MASLRQEQIKWRHFASRFNSDAGRQRAFIFAACQAMARAFGDAFIIFIYRAGENGRPHVDAINIGI